MTKRRVALVALAAVALAAVVLGVGGLIDLETLHEYHTELLEFVSARPVLAPLAFIGVYVVAIVVSLPAAAPFTVLGGYLFGWLEGAGYTMVAQMIGATTLFLLARRALAGWVLERAGPRLRILREGFRKDALSYLIVLRLVGLLPSFVVNAGPGALGVPLRIYLLGTLLGIIPGSLVYAGIGAGLSSLLEAEEALSPRNLLTPELALGLAGLVVLALLPMAYRRMQAHRHA